MLCLRIATPCRRSGGTFTLGTRVLFGYSGGGVEGKFIVHYYSFSPAASAAPSARVLMAELCGGSRESPAGGLAAGALRAFNCPT